MSRLGTGVRDLRVDVVRGLALISMYVAHCAPAGGPGNLLVLSEYLTYPLFAALVGAGAQLGRRRGDDGGVPGYWWSAVVRGAVLIGLGLLLETAGAQVVVVLVHLGLLTWVVAPLARAHTAVVAGVGAAAYVLAPLLHDALLERRTTLLLDGHTEAARVLDLTVTGSDYRLSSLVCFAAVGILLTRHLLPRDRGLQTRVGIGTAVAAAALLAASELGVVPIEPYEATAAEHLFDVLLLTAAFSLGVAAAGAVPRALSLLAGTGQMTLTLYAAHLCWLAYYAQVLRPGESDDSWANLVGLSVVSLLLPLVWRAVLPVRGAWARGPVEGAVGLLIGVGTRGRERRAPRPSAIK